MRALARIVVVFACTVLAPAAVFAQAITGVVKDTSGAVLPGVSVEATGPALLAPRAVDTDTSGVYRIVNLPPGTYALTYALSGFNKVIREGIELSGSAVLTIPIEMRVGALEESVTVTGASPVVDV